MKNFRLVILALSFITLLLSSSLIFLFNTILLLSSSPRSDFHFTFPSANASEMQGGFTVWVPAKMIAGEKYQGVVVTTNATDYPRDIILVSSNPDTVSVPYHLTIMPESHQATFNIDVRKQSQQNPIAHYHYSSSYYHHHIDSLVKISAVQGTTLSETGTTVYANDTTTDKLNTDDNNNLRLLAFNNTNLGFARVVALIQSRSYDGFFAIPSTSNRTVTIAYPGGISHATIDSQTGYGWVDIPLKDGANKISVLGESGSSSAPIDTITITRTPVTPNYSVKVSALSTIPAWSPEWGYVDSWVLIDASRDGKPLRGNFEVVATSSDPGIVEVVVPSAPPRNDGRIMCNLPCAIPVRGHNEGVAQIGVQISGIGGGSVNIATIQPVHYVAGVPVDRDIITTIIQKAIAKKYGSSSSTASAFPFAINSTSISYSSEKVISSTVSDGTVLYGLVGHYASISANYTVFTSQLSSITGQLTRVVPILIPGVLYQMSTNVGGSSSSGAAEAALLSSGNDFNGLMKSNNNSEITREGKSSSSPLMRSTSIGIGSSYAAMTSFDVLLEEEFTDAADVQGDITLTSLPGSNIILSGYVSGGAVRGYPDGNESVIETTTITAAPSSSGDSIFMKNNSNNDNGAFSSPSATDNNSILKSSSSPTYSTSSPLPYQLPINMPMQLEVEVPPLSYPAEGFTYAAHIINQAGVPIERVYPLYQLGSADIKHAGQVQEISSVFIHSRYVARVPISVVMNAINLRVQWPEYLKSNRPYNMTVSTNVPDAAILVSGVEGDDNSSIQGKAVPGSNNIITLFANGEGEKKVVISASKPGWTTTSVEKVIPVRKYINITIDAIDKEKGTRVKVPFKMMYTTVDDKTTLPTAVKNTGVTPLTPPSSSSLMQLNQQQHTSQSLQLQSSSLQQQLQQTFQGNVKTIEGTTPYVLDERPLVAKTITFGEASNSEENNGTLYVYSGKMREVGDSSSNNNDDNNFIANAAVFTGLYERQFHLTVINGLGTGYYYKDQNAQIVANPDKQILGFAIVEKFSHWEYNSSNSNNKNRSIFMKDRNNRVQNIALAGNGDATVTAIYATDYSTLLILILSTAAAIVCYAYREEIKTIMGAYRK